MEIRCILVINQSILVNDCHAVGTKKGANNLFFPREHSTTNVFVPQERSSGREGHRPRQNRWQGTDSARNVPCSVAVT
jgi:hypothetical protein